MKTLRSFLRKLKQNGWPQFYFASDVAGDLIGARVVCWFLDDCYGFMDLINSSPHLKLNGEVEDYIKNPKRSGYRSIHLVADIAYDSVQRADSKIPIKAEHMKCEVQLRTKLQDAWGDITHEFHYKAKSLGVDNANYETFLCDVSNRLANEDQTLLKFRNVYQQLAEEKLANETREGFRDE